MRYKNIDKYIKLLLILFIFFGIVNIVALFDFPIYQTMLRYANVLFFFSGLILIYLIFTDIEDFSKQKINLIYYFKFMLSIALISSISLIAIYIFIIEDDFTLRFIVSVMTGLVYDKIINLIF